MIRSLASLAILGLSLTACMPADTPTQTAASPFIGKQLVAENGTVFFFGADGTLGGTLGGEAIVGTYETNGAEICSTYTAPATLADREFCSTPAIDGTTVIFNRRDGSTSQPYEITG